MISGPRSRNPNAAKLYLVAAAVALVPSFLWRPTGRAQESVPLFEPAVCPIDVPSAPPVDCGYLVVPEDYEDPESVTIRLAVIIIRSRSQRPASDPILFTEGGPGYSSLQAVWHFANSGFVANRDVVIVEQRGNLYSEPSLDCDTSVWWEEGDGETACLDSLTDRGIDPTHYTTAAIVSDLEALRRTLDYEEWNLYGTSFSTRLMLLTMQQHPEHIRSAILQSVSPPTETRYEHDPEHAARALEVFLHDCEEDLDCSTAYPLLEEQLYTLIAQLNADPVAYEFGDVAAGDSYTVPVTGETLLGWMVGDAFYGPAYPPHKTAYLPLLVDEVTRGNTQLLYSWLAEDWPPPTDSPFAWGLYFAVNCQDEAPSITPEMIESQPVAYPNLDNYFRHRREIEICEAWDLPASPPLATEPLQSDIPTLVLAGSYDPITPPEWGRSVADTLSHSYDYEFPSAGHSVGTDNPCAESIKIAFLNDPTTPPDSSCIADLPNPEFILPQDIIIAPGVSNSANDVDLGNARGKPLLEATVVVCLLLFATEIGYLIFGAVASVARTSEPAMTSDSIAQLGHALAALVAILGVASPVVLTTVNNYISRSAPIVWYFGLPADYPPSLYLGLLALAIAVLTPVLAVVTILAWMRSSRSIWSRILLTLVTLAAAAFVGLMARWDLLTVLF